MILSDNFEEIHIGALGEFFVIPHLPSQRKQLISRDLLKLRHGDYRMGNAGIAQFHIVALIYLTVHFDISALHHAGIIQADPVKPLALPFPDHNTGCGLNALDVAGQTVLVTVAGNTSGSVAAHFSHGAVRIVKQHPVIGLRGGFHHHKAICADGQMPLTQRCGNMAQMRLRDLLLDVVDNDKIISRAVHLPKFHPLIPHHISHFWLSRSLPHSLYCFTF